MAVTENIKTNRTSPNSVNSPPPTRSDGSLFLEYLNRIRENGAESINRERNGDSNALSHAHSEKDQFKRRAGEDSEQKTDRRRTSNNETDAQSERGPGTVSARFFTNCLTSTDHAHRSILHVVDFERIVASLRTQTTPDSKLVVINLRHSVFEGLKLHVSFQEGKGLSAEFIALNDGIKSIIDANSDDLLRMFADRGISLKSLSVSVGSEGRENAADTPQEAPRKRSAITQPDPPIHENLSVSPTDSGISYLI